ncbi:MAG: hypothetical protein K2O33_08645, partial [Muribaculaceae bacterium]|nr:hypothetical protein [Muribaculaceae bacterium]
AYRARQQRRGRRKPPQIPHDIPCDILHTQFILKSAFTFRPLNYALISRQPKTSAPGIPAAPLRWLTSVKAVGGFGSLGENG